MGAAGAGGGGGGGGGGGFTGLAAFAELAKVSAPQARARPSQRVEIDVVFMMISFGSLFIPIQWSDAFFWRYTPGVFGNLYPRVSGDGLECKRVEPGAEDGSPLRRGAALAVGKEDGTGWS